MEAKRRQPDPLPARRRPSPSPRSAIALCLALSWPLLSDPLVRPPAASPGPPPADLRTRAHQGARHQNVRVLLIRWLTVQVRLGPPTHDPRGASARGFCAFVFLRPSHLRAQGCRVRSERASLARRRNAASPARRANSRSTGAACRGRCANAHDLLVRRGDALHTGLRRPAPRQRRQVSSTDPIRRCQPLPRCPGAPAAAQAQLAGVTAASGCSVEVFPPAAALPLAPLAPLVPLVPLAPPGPPAPGGIPASPAAGPEPAEPPAAGAVGMGLDWQVPWTQLYPRLHRTP
jgi:hypothetical protein